MDGSVENSLFKHVVIKLKTQRITLMIRIEFIKNAHKYVGSGSSSISINMIMGIDGKVELTAQELPRSVKIRG